MYKDFIKKVNSWEDVCKILIRDPNNLPDVSAYDEEDKAAAIASFKLWMISKASWGKVKIDYDNYNQRKYYGWFDMRSAAGSGSGFSFGVYLYVDGYSAVGARLSFPSKEILLHVVKVFEPEYKALYKKPQ